MKYNLKPYYPLFSEYTELRAQENRNKRIVLINGNITSNENTIISGISARVYKNGSWGFSAFPEINEKSINTVIESASKNAVFLDKKENKSRAELPGQKSSSENTFYTKEPKISRQDLVDFLKEIDEYITKTYSDLTSRTIICGCLDMEKILINSMGSFSNSMIPRAIIYIILSTEKDGKPVELDEVFGELGQFEDNFKKPSDLFDKINMQYEDLMKKKEGVFAEAGVKECILDAELTGLLAHEAIGHTTESDHVRGGSIASDYLNQTIAAPDISLVDFANTAFNKTCPVPVYIDDEGTKAEDVVVIDRGILKKYMHNKENAMYFNTSPAGNARAYQFYDEPLIRMRNTAFLPGNDKLEDMIASIDDGYYLLKPGNGQADSTSEFMFGVPLGFEIKKGKLGQAIKNTTISGVAFDVLKTVSMISDKIVWSNSGFCGKKQLIPVGLGGPAIKCKVNIGGK